ncbi:calcipressin-3 isoform X2 [Dermacentor silvarum]|uniref:calcipressin-3 isoform X2 n=1 Tax=Dermacentor silvarum TaxID=543639 RepID=UPI00210152B9|nr:calcipressin-3 isoform X2 [Dermacentor silvarum]
MKTRDSASGDMEECRRISAIEDCEVLLNDLADTSDLPTSLIITNVDVSIFTDPEQKAKFEGMFECIEPGASFSYFRSFRRARVNFESPDSAARARIRCDQMQFGESVLNCYFAQTSSPDEGKDGHLQPPPLERQFLISPPASPPVGWEPAAEQQPCINYDIITALASLAPASCQSLRGERKKSSLVHLQRSFTRQQPG